MKKILLLILFLNFHLIYSQNTINQNGIQTSVTNEFSANNLQARRYEIAKVGFNSHHWQRGSYIVVELFQTYFSSGYEKYVIQIGHGEGAQNTSPNIFLVEASGIRRNAKISLGNISDLSTSRGGYINKSISIYADVRYYTRYKARITFLRNKVDTVTEDNQIQINETPIGIDIPDFQVPPVPNTNSSSDGTLQITGSGNHYFKNGNVGIGTTTPDAKLTVKGDIHAEEVKIDLSVPAPDYVFNKDYDLLTIEEVQEHIAEQGHLPNIPSATEMETNGVALGLMNMKLLEKIEELTLYTIAQEEQLDSQQHQIDKLERDNKKLRSSDSELQTLKNKNKELENRMAKIEVLLVKE